MTITKKSMRSKQKMELTLTIDGVILDETGMNIYYTMKSKETVNGLSIQSVDLKNEQEIPPGGISYGGSIPDEKAKEWASQIKYNFDEPTLFKDLSFTLDMDVLFQGENISFSLPFELKENVKRGKTIVLNEEVEIESQKLTIKEITIYPLRVAVKIAFDEANSKKILGFEDMRLEDENGEVWGSIRNGSIAMGKETYYLQSNYFEEPKKLFLRINKMQALEKDEATLVVDTEKGEILKGPKDGRLQVLEASKSGMYLVMPTGTGILRTPMTYFLQAKMQKERKSIFLQLECMWTKKEPDIGMRRLERPIIRIRFPLN